VLTPTGTPLSGAIPAPAVASIREVLVIDDSPPTARALATLLARESFRPTVFHKGSEALEYARRHPCAAAVVDIHLPDMNGLVLSQKLREQLGPTVPIVILSGDTSMSTLNSLPHVGATHFFSKPVSATQLLKRLKEWIADSGKPD
jgi:DNA-binding response OmpR family regulator